MILRYCLHHPHHHHHHNHVITPPDKNDKVRGGWKIYKRHFRLRCRHVPDAALAVRVAYLVIIIDIDDEDDDHDDDDNSEDDEKC